MGKRRINVILIVFFIFFFNTDLAQAIQHDYVPLTVSPGDEITRTTSFTGAYKRLFAANDASGTAASWVTPRHIDFGTIDPGDVSKREYTITIPKNQNPGYYEIVWKWGCKYVSGETCSVTGSTVLQITVEAPVPVYTKPIPVYTPTSDDYSTTSVIIGLTLIIIIWIYVFIWVARDANKRGRSGTLWGILAFFLGLFGLLIYLIGNSLSFFVLFCCGLFGLLIYLIVRPKGNLVLCDYCGNERLETLTRCPHCKKAVTQSVEQTPDFEPAPVRQKPVTYHAVPQKPHAAIDDLKKLKEKLGKINELLDKLDERVAQGEITEAKYKELCEKYRDEADSLKNMITEKELMQEVGLRGDEK